MNAAGTPYPLNETGDPAPPTRGASEEQGLELCIGRAEET
jgi:hypothetical protein